MRDFRRKKHDLNINGEIQAVRCGEVECLQFSALQETGVVEHLFSTRLSGVSKGIYASMNVSFTRGDEEEAVWENFRRIAQAMDSRMEDFVFSHQTHTTTIRKITEADRGKGLTVERDYENIDGLITDVPGLVLATFFADCVPLFLIDPVHRAIGLSHSGWKGTVGKIGQKTLIRMAEEYGTRAEDVIAAIGPSICVDCYEVSEDVAEAFYTAFPQAADQEAILSSKGGGKYQLDLWRANRIILQEAGISGGHIAVTDICTCCNPELLFSHRASEGKRGNLGAFMKLKNQ